MLLEEDIRETSVRRLQVLEKYLKGGRLLEASCATGWFLDEAHRRGYQVRGVEISGFAARWGKENSGLDIHIGPLAVRRLRGEVAGKNAGEAQLAGEAA